MKHIGPLFLSISLVTGSVSALAQSTTRPQSEPLPEHKQEQHCVALKPGNPRLSEGIGILFGPDVSPGIVAKAVEHWSRCHGYQSDFPELLIGKPGSQTVQVKFENTYSRQPRCGSFVGRTIVLYAFAVDGKGRIQSCGSRVDGLAHELGHMLGLLDAPRDRSCLDHAMASIDVSDRNRREIQPEECQAVGERWLTSNEREGRESVLIANSTLDGG